MFLNRLSKLSDHLWRNLKHKQRQGDLSRTLTTGWALHAKLILRIYILNINLFIYNSFKNVFKILKFKIHQNSTFNSVLYMKQNSIITVTSQALCLVTQCTFHVLQQPAQLERQPSLPFPPFHRWCHREGTSCQLFSNLSKINIPLLK